MKSAPFLLAVAAALISACATGPSSSPSAPPGATADVARDPVDPDLDALVRSVTDGILKQLGPGPERVMAVSYFTADGEVSGISDELVGSLTTALAGSAKGRLKVVSRQVLDRLLAEASFQASDLADKEKQLTVGKQAGAELLLTGFITPAGDHFRLNAQLVEVETGVVVAAVARDFRAEGELAARATPRTSDTVLVKRERPRIAGASTTTTLFESFDQGAPEIQLEHREDSWGDRIRSASGTVELVERAGVGGSSCARFSFRAALESTDVAGEWRDAGLEFVARVSTGESIQGYDGIAIALAADGFDLVRLTLEQASPGGEQWFYLPLVLNRGEWSELRIPFASFYPADKGNKIDPSKPVTVSIAIPFTENWHRYAFRGGAEISCGLSVDDVGYFSRTSPEDPRVVDTFDDEIERLPLFADLYGTSVYNDYSSSDQGVTRTNPGVKGQSMRITRVQGGASGTGSGRSWRLEGGLDLTGEIRRFHDAGQSIAVFLSSPLAQKLSGFSALTFYVRSDVVTAGILELQDPDNERAFTYPFSVSGFWTRVRVPFAQWSGEQGSLKDAVASPGGTGPLKMMLNMDLPRQRLEQAGAGVLAFSVELDDVLLEK
jgi:TolB-like protein